MEFSVLTAVSEQGQKRSCGESMTRKVWPEVSKGVFHTRMSCSVYKLWRVDWESTSCCLETGWVLVVSNSIVHHLVFSGFYSSPTLIIIVLLLLVLVVVIMINNNYKYCYCWYYCILLIYLNYESILISTHESYLFSNSPSPSYQRKRGRGMREHLGLVSTSETSLTS